MLHLDRETSLYRDYLKSSIPILLSMESLCIINESGASLAGSNVRQISVCRRQRSVKVVRSYTVMLSKWLCASLLILTIQDVIADPDHIGENDLRSNNILAIDIPMSWRSTRRLVASLPSKEHKKKLLFRKSSICCKRLKQL